VKKLLIVVSLFALAVGAAWWWRASRGQTLNESAVTFAPFLRGDMRDIVSATGVLETRDSVVVGSELPAPAAPRQLPALRWLLRRREFLWRVHVEAPCGFAQQRLEM